MRSIVLKYNIYIMKTTYGFFKLLTYSSICTPIISGNRKINRLLQVLLPCCLYTPVHIRLHHSLSRIVKAYLRCKPLKYTLSYLTHVFFSTPPMFLPSLTIWSDFASNSSASTWLASCILIVFFSMSTILPND